MQTQPAPPVRGRERNVRSEKRCAHARYIEARLYPLAEAESETRPTAEWLAEYGRQIDNLRAALDWTFSPAGNPSLGVALTVAAVPLWMQLSLLQECGGRVERALSALDAGASRDQRREMKLRVALATSTYIDPLASMMNGCIG